MLNATYYIEDDPWVLGAGTGLSESAAEIPILWEGRWDLYEDTGDPETHKYPANPTSWSTSNPPVRIAHTIYSCAEEDLSLALRLSTALGAGLCTPMTATRQPTTTFHRTTKRRLLSWPFHRRCSSDNAPARLYVVFLRGRRQ
jgi:hypothetical protein